MTDDINPYESSAAPQPRRAAHRSFIVYLIPATIIGVLSGATLLAPFLGGPGDPSGRFIGASAGGFLGFIAAFVFGPIRTAVNDTGRERLPEKEQ